MVLHVALSAACGVPGNMQGVEQYAKTIQGQSRLAMRRWRAESINGAVSIGIWGASFDLDNAVLQHLPILIRASLERRGCHVVVYRVTLVHA